MKSRPDLLLLLTLLLVILLHPVLDHEGMRGLILGVLIFVPVILITIRLSQLKGRVWRAILLAAGIGILGIVDNFWLNPAVAAIKWGLLATFFAFTVAGLFSYIRNSNTITDSHLYTAVSIYLLLGLLWFALYSAAACFYPDAILSNQRVVANPSNERLYFSFVTLTTLGYGDVVAVNSEVRILAVLEAITGVLYIAITVAILVSRFQRQGPDTDSGGPPSTPSG